MVPPKEPTAGSKPSKNSGVGTISATNLTGLSVCDGRYDVRAVLGEGSMGVVYRAYDTRLETEVVLKIPNEASLNDAEFAERFSREIRSLVKLTHPHVVTILDVGVQDEVPFVVMQFCSGGSLRDRLVDKNEQQHKKPLSSIGEWLPHIAKALDFIHEQQFIHRDVKPANILFDQHNNAFLSDFGLVKVLSSQNAATKRDASLTAAGFLVGTPNYVAPELIMGHAHDGRVDQYSLAMTVYETLAGCVPLEGPTASATMVNQTSMKMPPIQQYVPEAPKALDDVLQQGLSKNQKNRFPNCVAFADAVMAAINNTSRMSQSDGLVRANVAAKSGRVSRGTGGKVPCPQCGKVLPLKPQFGGKKARCAQCLSLLQISVDLSTLRWLAGPPEPIDEDEPLSAAPRTSRASQKMTRDTARNGSQQTRRVKRDPDEVESLLGEELFGKKLKKPTMMWVFMAVLAGLVLSAIGIVWVIQDEKIRKVEEKSRLKQQRFDENQGKQVR